MLALLSTNPSLSVAQRDCGFGVREGFVMSVEIVRGTNQKPVSSDALVEIVSQQTELSGQLFIGYPIISTSEGRYLIDALLVSVDKGIIIFDLIEGQDPRDYGVRQDDSANKLEARLKAHRELMQRRNLMVPIHTVSFAPAINNPDSHSNRDYPLTNTSSLLQELNKFTWQHHQDPDVYEKVLSAIESISTIRKSRFSRNVAQENSRGAKLEKLENSIATLDNTQRRAVIETVEGVQRIRGLAGSGKTIVLALKASYLHAYHPDWRIAVTFNTRSLKEHFRRLINNFYIEQTGEEPDWNKLRIVNAWGAPGAGDRDGLYYEYCRVHDVQYFDFGMARSNFGQGREFARSCEYALAQTQASKPVYDSILVDEAQDLSPSFLRLCYELLNHPKRLVYAYDELQSLTGDSLPSPEVIFGKKDDGSPKVNFDVSDQYEPRRDIILSKCYRNSKPVLVTAHALGFGIYRKPPKAKQTGLVQMFDHTQLWQDIGYRVRDGVLSDGAPVTLYRPTETSPRFLEDHSDLDDLIRFISFESGERQADWLTQAIARNLSHDELRHDDIMVINTDPLTTRATVGPIRRRLLELGINSHLAGVDTDPNTFFQPGEAMVTFTGIHRAKGNEAGIVYIINAQDCHSAVRNLASIRNRLFTAITRSKAWVRVLGIGESMVKLKSEYDDLKLQDFELKFTYPNPEQREHLRVIHRDATTEESKRLKSRNKGLSGLMDELESGEVHLEDLDEDTVARFKKFLTEKR